MNSFVYDMELQYEGVPDAEEDFEKKTSSCCSVSDAFLHCRNAFHAIDIGCIASLSGASQEEVIQTLSGKAMFQDPAFFADRIRYRADEGWVFREQYLSGFLPEKLKTAERMNKLFPGHFDINIEVLKNRIKGLADPDQMEITLGSPFIPCDIYAEFIQHLLRLRNRPTVRFNNYKCIFEIGVTDKDDMDTIRKHPIYSTNRIHALENIVKTMNAETVKVYDTRQDYYGKVTRSVNMRETVLVQKIQQKLIGEFKEYVNASTVRLRRIRDSFKSWIVGFSNEPYDGSYLEFPDMNPDIKLYPRQKNIVARALESQYNMIITDPVGMGKSFVIPCVAHELYRTGISKRNLFVVPNNTIQDLEKLHHHIYGDDTILVISPSKFRRRNRMKVLEEIRDGDYVAIYIAASCFRMIKMSKAHKCREMEKEIDRLRAAAANAPTGSERSSLSGMADTQSNKLSDFIKEYEDPDWLCYDDLGIQTLFVDEAHMYKNISIKTRAQGVVGMREKGSAAADEMLMKVHFTDRTIFSTGTLLSNSLADLYTMMLYLQPEQLRFRKIHTFDMWINTFAERVSKCELDITSKLRTVTRFDSFHNLNELMSMFGMVCDFFSDSPAIPVKAIYEDVMVPIKSYQKLTILGLGTRADRVRRREVPRNVDNLLKITVDGRRCALEDGDKVKYCADKIIELYHRYPDKAQVVFCDIGTPKPGPNIYDTLRYLLVKKGIPWEEIAFVHSANNERKRSKLFEQINAGAVKVVIGSTEKLGVGVNIQKNLVALHHLSVPWRPSDLEQREGRILRRGNECGVCYIFRYSTEGTFDGYSWQLLENKQRFIASFLSGVATGAKVDDIADSVLTYAEIKALAIGNPLIRKRVETANRIDHLRITSHRRERELAELEKQIKTGPGKMARQKELIAVTEADAAFYEATRERISVDERVSFGEELIEALRENTQKPSSRIFDNYQGFNVDLPKDMDADRPYVNLVSANNGRYYAAMDCDRPMGCAQRLDILLDRLQGRAQEQRDHLTQMRRQLKDARADFARGNPYIDQIDYYENELKDIDKQLEESEAV